MDPLIYVIGMAILSIGFTVFYVNKIETKVRKALDSLGDQLTEGIQGINSDLEPIMKTNSKAMGYFQTLGDDTRVENTLDRKIGQDMMDQYGDIYEGIKLAFPRVAEYLDDRPEAITKLLPRLNTLISDPDTRKRLNLNLSGHSSDVSRIWREE